MKCDAEIHTDDGNWVVTRCGQRYLVVATLKHYYWAINASTPRKPITIHRRDVIEIAPNPLGRLG